MSDQIEERPEVRTILSEVGALETFSSNYVVKTPEQYNCGADDLKRVKGAQAKLEETRTGMTRPLNEALKKINDFFRAPAMRLSEIERAIKTKLIDYRDEQDRLRAAAQRKLDEAAERERRRLQEIADRATAKGLENKAESFATRAATVVAPVVQAAVPKVAGLSSRELWTFSIIDESKIPLQFMMPDEKKIGALVRSMKADAQAILGDGVKVRSVSGIASARA